PPNRLNTKYFPSGVQFPLIFPPGFCQLGKTRWRFVPSAETSHWSLPLTATSFLVNRIRVPSGDQRNHQEKPPASANLLGVPPSFGTTQSVFSWEISKSPLGLHVPSIPVKSVSLRGVPPRIGIAQSS